MLRSALTIVSLAWVVIGVASTVWAGSIVFSGEPERDYAALNEALRGARTGDDLLRALAPPHAPDRAVASWSAAAGALFCWSMAAFAALASRAVGKL
jgi:hypothetical protein